MTNKHPVVESFTQHGISPDPLRSSLEGEFDRLCGPVRVYDKDGNFLRTERGMSYDEAEWKQRGKRGSWSVIRPALR
jgi:hypothetical protein